MRQYLKCKREVTINFPSSTTKALSAVLSLSVIPLALYSYTYLSVRQHFLPHVSRESKPQILRISSNVRFLPSSSFTTRLTPSQSPEISHKSSYTSLYPWPTIE